MQTDHILRLGRGKALCHRERDPPPAVPDARFA